MMRKGEREERKREGVWKVIRVREDWREGGQERAETENG